MSDNTILAEPPVEINITEFAPSNAITVEAPMIAISIDVPSVPPATSGVFAFAFGSGEVILFGNGAEVGYNA